MTCPCCLTCAIFHYELQAALECLARDQVVDHCILFVVDRDKERLAKAVDERWEKRLQEGDPLLKGCQRAEVC
jgi:hypothetical protein